MCCLIAAAASAARLSFMYVSPFLSRAQELPKQGQLNLSPQLLHLMLPVRHSCSAQDNYLSRDEMLAALQEVGLLNGIKARQLGE